MKQFRIFLKNGSSFTVQAHGFKAGQTETPFVDENGKPNKTIYLQVSEVVAVVEVSSLTNETSNVSASAFAEDVSK